ncbi:MAG TPA: hypothetical protein VJ785_05660 [Anaerolineales bacterium]|nr:hypothetical protein [Anaerolineales bacterium]
MTIVQVYETTILDTTETSGFKFLIFPSRSLNQDVIDLLSRENAPKDIVEYLELKDFKYIELHSINDISIDIANRLYQDMNGENLDKYRPFAEYLTYSEIVPFEQSPLELWSLSNIAKKGGAVGLGTAIGYIAVGSTPWLLIAVPLGIVMCGGAISFAKWVEEKENRDKIFNKLLLKDR